MINFDRVSKRYPEGHEALGEVSFNIDSDELVFLTGHSGAGKSTLLKLIMLMERPSRGQVIVNGQNLKGIINCYSIVRFSTMLLYRLRSRAISAAKWDAGFALLWTKWAC